MNNIATILLHKFVKLGQVYENKYRKYEMR